MDSKLELVLQGLQPIKLFFVNIEFSLNSNILYNVHVCLQLGNISYKSNYKWMFAINTVFHYIRTVTFQKAILCPLRRYGRILSTTSTQMRAKSTTETGSSLKRSYKIPASNWTCQNGKRSQESNTTWKKVWKLIDNLSYIQTYLNSLINIWTVPVVMSVSRTLMTLNNPN